MKITQADIVNSTVSSGRFPNLAFGTTPELQQNLSFTGYAFGLSSGMTQSNPLFIHENISNTSAAWFDEGSWVALNVAITTVTYIPTVSSSSFILSTTTSQAVDGDLIGIFGPGTWSLGATLNTGRFGLGVIGSQYSNLVSGGATLGNSDITVEFFNGSIWTFGANLLTILANQSSAGSVMAAYIFGGNSQITSSELFNGASWSSGPTLNVGRYAAAGFGSQVAAGVVGGYPAAGFLSSTELFNGTSWVTGNNCSFSISEIGGAGSQAAAIMVGGQFSFTHLFNGSNWSFGGLNAGSLRYMPMIGTQNAGLMAGGNNNVNKVTTTQLYNGSAWYNAGNLSMSKSNLQGSGSQNAGIAPGGINSANIVVNSTELHNQTTYSKLTSNNIKEAKNIGIAFMSGSTTTSVVYNGYIGNLSVTTNNVAITASTAPGTFLVFPKYFPNTLVSSLIYTSIPNADDMIVGYVQSLTQVYVYGNSLNSYENIMRW